MSKIALSFKLARWHYTPVIIIPVVLGAALSWYQGHSFHWIGFLLCLVGAWFAHLGANAANDCFDDVSGVDRIAHKWIPENRGSTVCGSEIITKGLMTRRQGFFATSIFFLIAAACGAALFVDHGWPIAWFVAIGFVLGVFYCAAPIKFGYIGRGLGELGILVAFGPLPVLGSYYVQTGSLSWSALIASLVPGLFTVSVLYNHHFSHASADKQVGKMSPVVALGMRGARKITPAILAASYAALVINVALGIFPPVSLIALLTAPIIFRAYFKLPRKESCDDSLNFLFNVVRTNITTGALVIAAIVITRLWVLP